LSNDELLFSESNSRFIFSAAPENRKKLENIFKDIPHACIGKVTGAKKLAIRGADGRRIVFIGLDKLRKAFKKTLYGA
jgi:phosphoribosylformylglycinamidine synthase